MAAKVSVVTSAQVREWASAHGHKVGVRGRLHSTVIEAYNAGNKRKYEVGVKPEPGREIKVKGSRKTDSGRTVPWSKTVTTTEIRNAAIDAGIPMGQRGRLSQDVITAFANNTLADLSANWDSIQAAKVARREVEKQEVATQAFEQDETAAPSDDETVDDTPQD